MTRTITLTHEQANLLECYILMTTNYRKDEAEAWAELAKEKNEDGTPRFKNADSNSKYWHDLSNNLEEIRNIIENAPWSY